MSMHDWRRKISEAIERIRTRYRVHRKLKTGAPFLPVVVYPSEVETAFPKEWRTQVRNLHPEIDVRSIDGFEVNPPNHATEIGAANIVEFDSMIRCPAQIRRSRTLRTMRFQQPPKT